ncbi:hypothetical protein VKT23_007585 [Stygiomarasmius scandens]|uniref:Glucose-methanol-choline oxidoreductase N-terminal domain-containing protein n=1 Tax=Marasmiellus scandens TaxID=2682957 RepID=A0ABR1JKA2_9AGAR
MSSGKILGGDSAVNGLVWITGAEEEYDAYETLGSPGWNWHNMHQCLVKAEKLNMPSDALVDQFGFVVEPSSHGSSGPVEISFPQYLPIQHTKLVEACVELGHPFNRDPYSGNNTGVYYSLSSQTTNPIPTRETSEFAYLTPNLSANNLTVLSNATATRLVLKTSNSLVKATGVEFISPDGTSYTAKVHSHGEVILSAGTMRTPQLLELSGIGDRDVLEPLGIDVKLDLKGVGANFEDQSLTILTYQLKDGYLSYDALGYNETLVAEQQALYEQQGKGWFTFAQGVGDMSSAQTVLTDNELAEAAQILATKPDIIPEDQFNVIKGNVLNGLPQAEYILFNSFSGGENKQPNTSYISLAVTHLHPLSRGSIHINSTSIHDHPIIDPKLLSTEWDAWFLAKATAYGRKIMQTKAFGEILEEGEIWPGANTSTTDQWTEFVRKTVNTGYHPIGTASMLPLEKNGVVAANLLVYGTSNIRVADASIAPTHISAHTQTLAYTIGEKAAVIIKGTSC